MTLLVYDSTGILPANLVANENHAPISEPDVFTNEGPFFANSLVVTGTPVVGGGTAVLVYGQDYVYSPLFASQTIQTGKQIYSYILLSNYAAWVNIALTYQAIGSNITDQLLTYQILNSGSFDRTNLQNWLGFTGQQDSLNPTGVNATLSNAGVATLLANKINLLAKQITLNNTSV